MKGRESKGPPSADLLVCFPSRAHLTLIPKPICSPARPSEPSKRHHNHNHRRHHHHHHPKKSSSRGGGGQASSPLLWAKTKPMGSEISEPTSPKVTCAGQIKVRPKASSCKNWQSVMEEIERLHNNRKHKKKRANWVENFGFKKDFMQFLTCLRRIRFDFRCFGSFPTQGLTSDDEEEEEEEEEDFQLNQVGKDGNDGSETSRTVFSKWFMVLQEEQNINNRFTKEESKKKDKSHKEEPIVEACAPPSNALLLMRCRSAPAKTWLEEREHEDDKDEEEEEEEEEEEYEAKLSMEEEKRSKCLAAVMRRDTDFYNVSSDIAKETWVNVGGLKDPLSRSRSWKR